ncbi:ANK-REP-region domain-containing protein [Favolaschia claudopus]|uniref:ANK-REP-region domain-containing protein n=1 Tax=Favolaschia claudopus TaxID=2862362 RepID=A0AAW0E902_9AGAR
MSNNFFTDELPPELVVLLASSLSPASLNALALTCRRLHSILQPELDARLTSEVGKELLLEAANSGKTDTVAKLLAHPFLVKPNAGFQYEEKTPLHAAAYTKNTEAVALLLDAGADIHAIWDQDEYQPLHLAVMADHLPTVKLLLDRGSQINSNAGCDGASFCPLHLACESRSIEIVSLLLERGANTELEGHHGTALAFALRSRRLDVMELLLKNGAKAEVNTPLNGGWMCGGPPAPYSANLLYIALGLTHPSSEYSPKPPPAEGRPERMAYLMAYGADREETMKTVTEFQTKLAEAAEMTEEALLELVQSRFNEAQSIMPSVVGDVVRA